MALSKQIGKHYVECSGDTMFMRYEGPFSDQETVELLEVLEKAFPSEPYYALLDHGHMGEIEAAARKRLTTWTASRKFLGAAIYGANLTTRTLTILVQSAIRLVGKKAIPISFVKTPEEGRAWIAEQRKARAQSAA